MSKCVRSPLLVALLLGLTFGCAHRPDPTAIKRRHESAAPLEVGLALTLQPIPATLGNHPGLPDANPPSAPSRLNRGQSVFITPNAFSYAAAATSAANLRLDLEIRKPGISRPVERTSLSLRNNTETGASQVPAAPASLRFKTSERDPLGEYRLTMRLVDEASGQTRVFTRTFQVEAYKPPILAADFDAQTWLTHYYLLPTPDLALPALNKLHFNLPVDQRPGALPPLLGFYDQLLQDNPWLLPAFSARLAAADPDEAYLLSLMLGFHLRHAGESRPADLDEATWIRLTDFRTYAWPSDPEAPLADIAQLDALWGRFFASGRYDALQALLRPLALSADLGAIERWQQDTRSADAFVDTPPAVQRDLLLRSAIWSLRSNARQHPLVRNYLEQSLASGNLSPDSLILLHRILNQASAP